MRNSYVPRLAAYKHSAAAVAAFKLSALPHMGMLTVPAVVASRGKPAAHRSITAAPA